MSLELLVLTLDDVLIRTDELRRAGIDLAPRERGTLRAHEDAFIAACGQQAIPVRPQALALMRSAESGGARLALAAPVSSRMLCALLDGAIGPDWTDRFAVVATADALSARETEADLYRLVLRTAEAPAHRALLVGATQGSLRAASGIGMHTAAVLPPGSDTPHHAAASITLSGTARAAWPDFHVLESIVAGQHGGHSASRAMAEPVTN
ncbi:hypothetical protein UB46_40305 [Burkholderiaceae bacterium 16]|nr:hypothetical protein UB46_40305 [Burkholderiaceae bacterium 16]